MRDQRHVPLCHLPSNAGGDALSIESNRCSECSCRRPRLGRDGLCEGAAFKRSGRVVVEADREHAVIALNDERRHDRRRMRFGGLARRADADAFG